MSLAVPIPLEQSTSRMTANLLLIDDNAVQAATRQTILRRAGYFVIAALNPARALEQIQSGELPEEIRLVITDHLMPGMSGADFVRALRKTHPTLPVLVISGLEEAEQEYAGLNVTFRMKPLLPDNLLETVRRLVGESGGGSRLSAVSKLSGVFCGRRLVSDVVSGKRRFAVRDCCSGLPLREWVEDFMQLHPMPEFGSFTLLLALALSVYTLVMGGVALWRTRGCGRRGGPAGGQAGGDGPAGGNFELCRADLCGVCAGVGFVHE